MFPDTGRKLPAGAPPLNGSILSERVGLALRSELGTSRQATKTVMAWTGVCDKAARLWISGNGGVSGANLLLLASRSDAIWRTVLELAIRNEAAVGFEIHAVEVALSRALGSIELIKRQAISRHGN